MSGEKNAKNEENDMSVLNVSDQPNTTPHSSPASSASSLERSNSTDGNPLLSSGIIEVSDDNKDDMDEVEEIQMRRTHMPLRRAHANYLMQCGHPGPPADRTQVKKWATYSRSWCQVCNPLTTRNLVRGSNVLSGWRKTMEQLVEKNIFPLSVLNLNETFIYIGNNGNEDNGVISVTPGGPPFMLDLDVFLGIVCANDLCRLPLRALTCLRSFIHSDTRVIPFFEKIHPQSLCHFSVNLLETAIRLMEEPQENSEIQFRRSKVALNVFYQTSLRVPFFRETICKHQLSHWINLLRVEFLQSDIISSLLMVIREMHSWFFNSDDLYIRLLSDILLLYSAPTGGADHRGLITNIFIVLFHADPSFLYNCYHVMDRDTFTELLHLVESALNFAPIYRLRDFDHNIPSRFCVNPSNLSFCLELFELIDRELSECRVQKFDTGPRFTILAHIISICSMSRDSYSDILNKGNAISLICALLKAIMFAQREFNHILIRAQHIINNNAQRAGTNSANAKFRYEAQQRGALKTRQNRDRIQTVQPYSERNNQAKRPIKNASDYDNGTFDEQKMKEEQKAVQITSITSTDDFQEFGTRTQHAFDVDKQEWKLEKEEELPIDIQETHENGDEPRKKHARLNSGSESSKSPTDELPEDNQLEAIQVDDSAEMEENSQSDVSCSSSDEAPPLPAQRQIRLPTAKVAPLLNNPANINIGNKMNANCYEEFDDEEESDIEESCQNGESIFGPRAEILFNDYMLEKAADFDLNSLNEDELLAGLPTFRSNQQICQILTRHIPTQLFANLKQYTLKALDNLCKNCGKNRLIAGRLDAIPLILQCSMEKKTPVLQLGILALRSLCLDCPENQDRLLDVTEACSHFIDRQLLFRSMGVELAVDKSGKQILLPVDKE